MPDAIGRVVVQAANLRLRAAASPDAGVLVLLERGTQADLLDVSTTPGWAQVRVQPATGPVIGWCLRRMLDSALHAPQPDFPAAQARLWDLAQQYTAAKVGYAMGARATGLRARPPVIDCSGWAAFVLQSALRAQNVEAREPVFVEPDIAVLDTWSDRMILEIEARTALLLEGRAVNLASLRAGMAIGLNADHADAEPTGERVRNIDHIVVVVRRPTDLALFISESCGPTGRGGVRLTSLARWLAAPVYAACVAGGRAWAVDALAMADPFSAFVTAARQ